MRNVRKRFVRLADMALLLSADSREVALEYIRDGSVTALNEEEAEKTLGLRAILRLPNSWHKPIMPSYQCCWKVV